MNRLRAAVVSMAFLTGVGLGWTGLPAAVAYADEEGPCDPEDLTSGCNMNGTTNCTSCPARRRNYRGTLAWCCPVDGQSERRCDCAASRPTNCTAAA